MVFIISHSVERNSFRSQTERNSSRSTACRAEFIPFYHVHNTTLSYCQSPSLECQFFRDGPALGDVPKPGQLAFGEVAAARLDPRDRLRQGSLAIKISKRL